MNDCVIDRDINIKLFNRAEHGSAWVAKQISDLIREKAKNGEFCVLGLATGGTPVKVYKELIRMHHQEGLSFSNVITFNLDEYYPMDKNNKESYHRFMFDTFFNHVDIPESQIHIPDGSIHKLDIEKYCNDYEEKIRECGGIDIQLLGIGRSGHIGFNEPGSELNSKTRLVDLDEITRKDAISQFKNLELVPNNAITMGIKTILSSRKIFLMAWGNNKYEILKRSIREEATKQIPATFLKQHQNVQYILDCSALQM